MGASTFHKRNGMVDRVQEIRDDAQALSASLRDAVQDLEGYLSAHIQQQPALTLTVAAGVGFVLGGGLRSRLNSLLLSVASKMAIAVAARELSARIAGASDTSSRGV